MTSKSRSAPQIWARQLARKDIKNSYFFRTYACQEDHANPDPAVTHHTWLTKYSKKRDWKMTVGCPTTLNHWLYWIIMCCCLWGPDKSLISWRHNGFWLKVSQKLSSLSEVLISNIVNIAFMYVTYFQVKQNDFVIDEYTVLKSCMLIHHYLTFKHFFFGINRYDTSIQ